MCRGDDPSCSEFELHHRQFVEDMARERRAFLASRFAARGGAATPAAGGLALPKTISPATRHHHLPANADTVHWGYFSKNLKPQLDVESGDFVTIETLTHQASDDHERMIAGDPGAESVYLWTKDRKGVARRGAGEGDGKGLGVHICTGPVLVQGAEPGDVLEVRIVDVTLRPCANPTFRGLAFGSNAAANWGYHYNDFLTGETRNEWVLHGFSLPNYLADLGPDAQVEIFRKSSVDLAMCDAFRKMRRFLMTAKNLTEDEAISLMSIAVDFGITQVVDGNWGVHAIVRKDIFPA